MTPLMGMPAIGPCASSIMSPGRFSRLAGDAAICVFWGEAAISLYVREQRMPRGATDVVDVWLSQQNKRKFNQPPNFNNNNNCYPGPVCQAEAQLANGPHTRMRLTYSMRIPCSVQRTGDSYDPETHQHSPNPHGDSSDNLHYTSSLSPSTTPEYNTEPLS